MFVNLLFMIAALLCVVAVESLQVALGLARPLVLSGWAESKDDAPGSHVVKISDFILAGRLISSAMTVVFFSVGTDLWDLVARGRVRAWFGASSLGDFLTVLFGVSFALAALGLATAIGIRLGERFPNQVVQVASPLARRITWWLGIVIRSIRGVSRVIVPSAAEATVVEEQALEEDIRSLVEEGEKAGVIEEEEREIISRVFKLGDRPLPALMTPRSDVVFLPISCEPEDALTMALESRFSWFPSLGDTEDEVLGIVSIHDLVEAARDTGASKRGLRELLVKPLEVPESITALDLLEKFREGSIHFAVIRDEYGGVAGIATLDDVLRMIVGDVGDPGEEVRMIVRRDDGSLLVDASSDVRNLFELLELNERFDDAESQFHSVGGFVMTSLGRIPKEGDFFEQDGFRFEVVDMDGKRIDKILVNKVAGKEAVGQ
jgi:CBS domain containing-hemolysin-like protein